MSTQKLNSICQKLSSIPNLRFFQSFTLSKNETRICKIKNNKTEDMIWCYHSAFNAPKWPTNCKWIQNKLFFSNSRSGYEMSNSRENLLKWNQTESDESKQDISLTHSVSKWLQKTKERLLKGEFTYEFSKMYLDHWVI